MHANPARNRSRLTGIPPGSWRAPAAKPFAVNESRKPPPRSWRFICRKMTCRWWGRRFLGTCNITQFAQNPLAGISAVAAFSCTCILSETANQPKLDISGQNGYFCKFLGFACQPHYFSASEGGVANTTCNPSLTVGAPIGQAVAGEWRSGARLHQSAENSQDLRGQFQPDARGHPAAAADASSGPRTE